MTLEELEEKLPNGLHDAQLSKLEVDYELGELTMWVEVLVGLPDEPAAERDRYRSGKIIFQKLQFCTIEPPNPTSGFKHPGAVWFSYERLHPGSLPQSLNRAIPPRTQCYALFIQEWLAHIQIAAEDVAFSWI